MKQRTLKLQRIYKEGSAYLESRQIPDAQIDAWYLLESVVLPTMEIRKKIFRKRKRNGIGNIWKSVHEEFHFSILREVRSLWDMNFLLMSMCLSQDRIQRIWWKKH